VYCYTCNEERVDPEIAAHLAAFGIAVSAQTKTEKSMTELQLEHNLTYDFSLTAADGGALAPAFGPGLTGLQNLGNSCYMASVLQTLFALPAFQAAYAPDVAAAHWAHCGERLPAGCVSCQMLKLADGLRSGRYSHPSPPAADAENALAHERPAQAAQAGVRPAGFKALVGRGHAEFATMRQQDAEEFLSFLLEVLRRDAHRAPAGALRAGVEAATGVFGFATRSRLQCTACGGVRYREDGADVLGLGVPAREAGKTDEGRSLWHEVKLEDCLGAAFGAEELSYRCPRCARDVAATKSVSQPAGGPRR
jgi:ubiquitin carboxyl-terminal hydrolase 5/13